MFIYIYIYIVYIYEHYMSISLAMVHIVYTRPLIPFTKHLVTVPRAPITMCITVIFMFHSFFFYFWARSWYLFFFSLSFKSTQWLAGTAKSKIRQSSFSFLMIIRPGRLAEIRWSVYISKSQRRFCVSCFRTDSGLCIYHLFEWSNFNFLHNSQWITLLTQLCPVLHSFYTNLLHLLIIWLIVSSLSPHYYYYYYYYYYYLLIRVFHISWWFFTGVWVTASVLKSPGLFTVLCPISKM